MDQVEIEFSSTPIVFSGKNLRNFSTNDGVKSETFEASKEFNSSLN